MTNSSNGMIAKEVYVPDTIKTVTMIIFCIVSVVGVIGNLLTILSVLLNKKLKSIPNVYICTLAIADFIVCAVIAPFSAYMFTLDPRDISPTICTFIGALNAGLLSKTIFSLTAIAINRFILLVKGSRLYTQLYTRRNVIITLVILWLLPVVMVLPALIGFGQFGYNSMMGTCIFASHDVMTYIYVQTMLHGACVGPCVIITLLCYTRIIIHFRKTQNRLKMSTHSNPKSNSTSNSTKTGVDYVQTDDSKVEDFEFSSSGPSNNNSTSINVSRSAKRAKTSRRVVTNLCTVFTVFLLCWLPIVTLYTIDFYNQSPAAVSHIFFAIAVSNSCLNVFIYAGMNPIFRKSYKNILTLNFSKFGSSL